jgi:hypothetical protein
VAWTAFVWGSRGPYWDTGIGVYVADRFIPECIQVNVFGRYAGLSDLEHVFHVRSPIVPPDYSTCFDVADVVRNWCSTTYKALLPEEIRITRVVATAIDRVNGPQAEIVVAIDGTVLGDMMPAATTLCVKKAGTTRGRRRRGRWYTWPTIQGNTANNLFVAGYANGIVTGLNLLLSSLDTNGTPMVIGSLTDGLMHDVSTFVLVDLAVDNMRRRGQGRGR